MHFLILNFILDQKLGQNIATSTKYHFFLLQFYWLWPPLKVDTNTTNLASLLVQVLHPTGLGHKAVSQDLQRLHPFLKLHRGMNIQPLHQELHQVHPIILPVPIKFTQDPVNALNQVFQAKDHHLRHIQVKAHRVQHIPVKILLHRFQVKDQRHLDRVHLLHHIQDKVQPAVAYLANQDLAIQI